MFLLVSGLRQPEPFGIITWSIDACSVRVSRSEEAEMNKRQSVGEAGPLSLYTGGVREDLEGRGYATDSVAWRLRQLTALDRWVRDHHLAANDLDAECVTQLVAARRAEGRTTLVAVSNFSVPIGYLREIGVV